MEGKKKHIIIILAIILAILLFLFVRSCSNDKDLDDKNNDDNKIEDVSKDENDETLEDEENDKEETEKVIAVDNSYEKALAAVLKAEKSFSKEDIKNARNLIKKVKDDNKKSELTKRVDIVEEAIEAINLVEKAEELVKNTDDKEDVENLRNYVNDNEIMTVIENLRNETVKDDLKERMEEVNRIINDDIAPLYEGIKDGEITNKNILITISDDTKVIVSASLNGNEYEYKENEEITEEGIYKLTLIDEAFNEVVINFTIDKTAPVFENLEDNKHYEEVLINVKDDTKVVITVNNLDANTSNEVKQGTKLTDDASYVLTAKDEAGNETTIKVIIDTTSPEISGISDNELVNKKVTLEVSDKFLNNVSVNGTNYTKDSYTCDNDENCIFVLEVETDGEYTIVATDEIGNSTTKTFIIDMTLNDVVVNYSITDITKEKVEVTLTSDEDITLVEDTTWISISGYAKEFKKTYSENTVETITYKDKAGNEKTVEIRIENIDKNPPVIKNIENGKHYKEVIISVEDENLESIKLNGIKVQNGTTIKINGTYKLEAIDKAGNTSTVTFTVDSIAPIIFVLDKIEFLQSDLIPIKPVIIDLNLDTVVVKKDGVNINYKQGDQLTEQGSYEIIATDKAGNSSTTTFTIDNREPIFYNDTKPIPTLIVSGFGYQEVTIKVLEENFDENSIFVLKKENVDTSIGISIPIYKKIEYTYGDTITEEGEYIVVAADKALNISFTKFVIDKTKPTVSVSEGEHYSSVKLEIVDATLVDELTSLRIKTNELLGLPIYEKVEFTSGDIITEEGEYLVTAVDQAGNTTTVHFVIDTTAPTVEGVTENGRYIKVSPIFSDLNPVSATLNGNNFVSGTKIIEDGEYTLIVTDKAGNTTTVNFIVDSTAISFENIEDGKKYKEDITPSVRSHYNLTSITLDGNSYNIGDIIATEGTHTLVAVDSYGNEASVTFSIDKTAPTITTTFNTQVAGVDGTSLDVRALVEDNIDSSRYIAPVVTHSVDGELGALESIETSKSKVGTYTLVYKTSDSALNETTKTVVVEVLKSDVYIILGTDNSNLTSVYDGTNKLSTIAKKLMDSNGEVSGDVELTVTDLEGNPAELVNVGTYKITATTTSYNYVIPTEIQYTITQKEVAVKFVAEDTSSNNNVYEYDQQVKTYKAYLVDYNTEGVIEIIGTYSTSSADVGEYTLTASYPYDGNDNYVLKSELTQSVTIEKATLVVNFPTSPDENGLVTPTITNSQGKTLEISILPVYLKYGKLTPWGSEDYKVPVLNMKNSGKYKVNVTILETNNYNSISSDSYYTVS